MKPSIILVFIMRPLVWFFVLISFQILWRGHNLPGGGFIAGLVAGSVLSLAGSALGLTQARKILKLSPTALIFVGLSLAMASSLIGYFFGTSIFEGVWVSVPLVEKLGSPLLFDVGVYLVVIGFCLAFSWGLLEDPIEQSKEGHQ